MQRDGSDELRRLASDGRFADVVGALLHCLRDGGQKVLESELRALDNVDVKGEVATVAIASDVVHAMHAGSATNVVGALQLAYSCAQLGTKQREALLNLSSVKHVLSAMVAFKDEADVQLEGMLAMSGIIGPNIEGLKDFVRCKGLEFVEDMMQRHPQDPKLQLRAIKQITSAVAWPDGDDLRRQANFDQQRTIALTKQAMLLHPNSVEIQTEGVKALSKLVGDSYEHLFAFASCGGLDIIEQAMLRHPENGPLQEECIKALSGGAKWPNAVCQQTGYSPEKVIALIKQTMSLHFDNEQIQIVAAERLSQRFLGQVDIIARCRGADLLRSVIVRHPQSSIRDPCKKILDAMGEPGPNFSKELITPCGRSDAVVRELELRDLESS